jgi:hypothetical protein
MAIRWHGVREFLKRRLEWIEALQNWRMVWSDAKVVGLETCQRVQDGSVTPGHRIWLA